MPVVKHDYPILEYDEAERAIISPNRHGRPALPRVAVMTFFGEVLARYVAERDLAPLSHYGSETRNFPIYAAREGGVDLCVVQAPVGSASAAMLADFLIGYGARAIVACGGCGVLADIPAGDVIVPTAALRDEGPSYHYLPPAREIELDLAAVWAIEAALGARGVPFVETKTWTTDAFYRETPDMVDYRRREGCQVVEMECASLAAVARRRGATFGQLLYSGDILVDPERYDERDWVGNLSAREKLFALALEAAVRL